MDDIKIDKGERLDLLVEDAESATVTIFVGEDADSTPVITKSATFTDGVATIELLFADTNIPVGDYVYQIRLFDDEGEYFNLDRDECDEGDCTLGAFTVCASIQEGS